MAHVERYRLDEFCPSNRYRPPPIERLTISGPYGSHCYHILGQLTVGPACQRRTSLPPLACAPLCMNSGKVSMIPGFATNSLTLGAKMDTSLPLEASQQLWGLDLL